MSWVIESKADAFSYRGTIVIEVPQQKGQSAFDALEIIEQAFAKLPNGIKVVGLDDLETVTGDEPPRNHGIKEFSLNDLTPEELKQWIAEGRAEVVEPSKKSEESKK